MIADNPATSGFAEYLQYTGTLPELQETHPRNLDMRTYTKASGFIPLSEIDSPYDVYDMYQNGALDLATLDEFLAKEEPLFNLKSKPKIGDIVLIHFSKSKITKVCLLVDTKTYDVTTLKFYKTSRRLPHQLCMMDLGKHRNFQHIWTNGSSHQF
jgi:hypothetical protein